MFLVLDEKLHFEVRFIDMDQQPNDDDVFSKLEEIVDDPVVVRFYQNLEQYHQLIKDDAEITSDELLEIIQDLDMQWPYFGEEIVVSGWVCFPDSDTGELEKKWFDDASMLSKGFSIERVPIYVDGDEVGMRQDIVHVLSWSDHEHGVIYTGSATADGVTVSYPFDSIEAKRKRLEYHYPDLIDIVDEQVLNATNEEEAVIELAKITISQVNDDPQILEDLGGYIDAVLGYDKIAPYYVTLDDTFYVVDDEGDPVTANLEEPIMLLVAINSTVFVKGVDHDDVEVCAPALDATFIPPDGEPSRKVIVPLKSIVRLRSVRRKAYEQDH